jgi:molybdopterin/thiamine biosynthesis adenylyltransferase
MKCTLPESVISKCELFVHNFNKSDITNISKNIIHQWQNIKRKYIYIRKKSWAYTKCAVSTISCVAD